jgi:hypothetical protein
MGYYGIKWLNLGLNGKIILSLGMVKGKRSTSSTIKRRYFPTPGQTLQSINEKLPSNYYLL